MAQSLLWTVWTDSQAKTMPCIWTEMLNMPQAAPSAGTNFPYLNKDVVHSHRELTKTIATQDLAPNQLDESSMKCKRLTKMHQVMQAMTMTCNNRLIILI